jgi:tetratricopeptide (TPR) repeat protein
MGSKKPRLLLLSIIVACFGFGHCVYAYNVNDSRAVKDNLEQYYIDMGLKSYHGSRYEDALKNFNSALYFNKNNPIPWQYIGIIYFEKGAYNKSLGMFNKSLELEPDSLEPNLYMARIYEAQNDIDQALVYYREVIRIDPDNKDIYIKIFETCKDNSLYRLIIEYGKAAIRDAGLSPGIIPYIYMWVGYAYIYLGHDELAIAYLSNSKRLQKRDTPDYLWISGLIDILSARRGYKEKDDKEDLDNADKVLRQILKNK